MTNPPIRLRSLLEVDLAPQRGFAFPRENWSSWFGHLGQVNDVIEGLPARLDRATALGVVEALLPSDIPGAFVTSMVWGHGASSYGPFRTARILTGSEAPSAAALSKSVVERLRYSVELAREQGPVEGYRYLNNRPGHVENLGPAFFTKWLYFVTAQGDPRSATAAPILDDLILTWLNKTAGLSLTRGKTDDYGKYLDVLQDWGSAHGRSAAEVEEAIFRLIRDDGRPRPGLPAGDARAAAPPPDCSGAADPGTGGRNA